MLIEVSKAEKELLEHALLRLSLSTKPFDQPMLEDAKALWYKIYFLKLRYVASPVGGLYPQLAPIPEFFTLEESDND
jgi:hypothetical protein